MKTAALAVPQMSSAQHLSLGKTLRKPVPNTALNCLIGIASSKTILIERLFKHRIERLFKHSPQRRGAGEARALHA